MSFGRWNASEPARPRQAFCLPSRRHSIPELPDVCLYRDRISERIAGQDILGFRTYHPGALASVLLPGLVGSRVQRVDRMGKRIVLELDSDRAVVIHPMIAGRFVWAPETQTLPPLTNRNLVFAIAFGSGVLSMQEFGKKRRARIAFATNLAELASFRRDGIDVLASDFDAFRAALVTKNRTLKRALTDPQSFDGIGNAYSDEILWRARLSPVRLTQSLINEEVGRLRDASVRELSEWTAKLAREISGFPKPAQITAFRPEFHVHGKFGKPCSECCNPVQRIVYAENETNYCAQCQNEGRLLADRSLSRLLKGDWPKTLEEMLGD